MGTSFGKYVKRFYGGDWRGICYSITNGIVAFEITEESAKQLQKELSLALLDTELTLKGT